MEDYMCCIGADKSIKIRYLTPACHCVQCNIREHHVVEEP